MTKTVTGIIIFASGLPKPSQPKQDLIFRGQTLLQRAIETALSTVCETIMVVSEANSKISAAAVDNIKVNFVENPDLEDGETSSIRLGTIEIQKTNPDINSIILMAIDQPFVDTHVLNMLILSKTKSGIACCEYNNTPGLPALFDKFYFDELKESGEIKNIVTKHKDTLTIIPFEPGSIHINCIEDADRLNQPH